MVIKLMVGGLLDAQKHKNNPHNHLRVWQQEYQEYKPLEIQLFVGLNAQSVGDCQQDVPHYCGDPVNGPTLLRTEKFEGQPAWVVRQSIFAEF